MIKSNHTSRPAQVIYLCALSFLITPAAIAGEVVTVKTNRSGYNINIQPFNFFKKSSNAPAHPRGAPQPAAAQPQARGIPIDSRWKEWHSNAVLLLDAARLASEANDLVETERNLAKFCYGKALAKSEEENLAAESRRAKKVEELEAKRAKLVQQRDAQQKFQNTEAVAKFDAQIQEVDHTIQHPQTDPWVLASRQPANLLAKELSEGRYGGNSTPISKVVFLIAHEFRQTGEDIGPAREQLAQWANRAGTSQQVLSKALALNSQLKEMQEGLASGRTARAQKIALAVWKSMLD